MVINVGDTVRLRLYGTGVVVQTKEYIDKLIANSRFDLLVRLDIKKDCYYDENGYSGTYEDCRFFYLEEIEEIISNPNKQEIIIW